MKKLQFTDKNGVTYERINKRKAKRLYNDGKTVILCPVNIRPFGFCNFQGSFNRNNCGTDFLFENFEKLVDFYEHYNCNHCKTGYYAAFYFPMGGFDYEHQ